MAQPNRCGELYTAINLLQLLLEFQWMRSRSRVNHVSCSGCTTVQLSAMDIHSPKYMPKPSTRPLWVLRARRFCRLWLKAWLNACSAPFTDASGVFNLVALIVAGVAAYWAHGYEAVRLQVIDTWGAIHALATAIAVYALLCAINAFFSVRNRERISGEWHGGRFVYREPKVVFFRRVTDTDNFKPFEFFISEGEPGGYVELRVECDGMGPFIRMMIVQAAMPDALVKVEIANSQPRAAYNTTVAVPYDKKFKMLTLKDNPNPTNVRVSLSTWAAN